MYVFAFLVLIWGVASAILPLNTYFLPDILGVLRFLFDFEELSAITINLVDTLQRVIVGILFSSLLAIPAGFYLAFNTKLKNIIMPLIDFVRGIPTSMLFPVIIVFMGIGELSKLFIVVLATIPILLISALTGASKREENSDRRDYISIHYRNLSRSTIVMGIIWDALPNLISGTKISISISLVLVIVTEMFFVSNSGLGYAAHQAYLTLDLDEMYTYVIIVGVLGLAFNQILDRCFSLVSGSKNNGN